MSTWGLSTFLRLSSYSGRGQVGGSVMVWSLTRPLLPYVKFKVTTLEVVYKAEWQFEENTRHSTVIALGIAYTLQWYQWVSVWTYLLTLIDSVTYFDHDVIVVSLILSAMPLWTIPSVFGRPYYRSSLWYSMSSVCLSVCRLWRFVLWQNGAS